MRGAVVDGQCDLSEEARAFFDHRAALSWRRGARPYRRPDASMTARATTTTTATSTTSGQSIWSSRSLRAVFATAIVPVAVAGIVFVVASQKLSRERDALSAFRVRLGMTPADVRATFAPPAAGPSQWRVDSSGETALEWRGSGRSFRFEFHNAQLMAVRAVLDSRDPSTHGDALEVSTATVLRRHAREDGRVELTLLARDCPSHAEEARRLITGR